VKAATGQKIEELKNKHNNSEKYGSMQKKIITSFQKQEAIH
jgi:hypothetical protein